MKIHRESESVRVYNPHAELCISGHIYHSSFYLTHFRVDINLKKLVTLRTRSPVDMSNRNTKHIFCLLIKETHAIQNSGIHTGH